jgi:hypothetical protein
MNGLKAKLLTMLGIFLSPFILLSLILLTLAVFSDYSPGEILPFISPYIIPLGLDFFLISGLLSEGNTAIVIIIGFVFIAAYPVMWLAGRISGASEAFLVLGASVPVCLANTLYTAALTAYYSAAKKPGQSPF